MANQRVYRHELFKINFTGVPSSSSPVSPHFFPALSLALFFARALLSKRLEQATPASFLGFYTVNFHYFCCKDVVVSDVSAGKAERNFVHKFCQNSKFSFSPINAEVHVQKLLLLYYD